MTWRFFTTGSMAAAELALTWLIQSTVLLVLGVLAGRLLRRSGPAVQSAVYRTTLAAVLLCPCTSILLTSMGCRGLLLRMPIQVAAGASSEGLVPPDSTPASGFDTTAGHSDDHFRNEKSEPKSWAAALRAVDAPSDCNDEGERIGVERSVRANVRRYPGLARMGCLVGLGCVAHGFDPAGRAAVRRPVAHGPATLRRDPGGA